MSEVIQSVALFNLLDKKGIITKQELLEEMKRGRHANGRIDWKNAKGHSLKELQEQEAGA
jgi:hypothetical protein